MKKKKTSELMTPSTWTVKDLGSFFVEFRSELFSHAFRMLKDRTRAEEVVQEAFMKVLLANPELTSSKHALSYLHRTIENLCLDLFRYEGRRPKLVLVDDIGMEFEPSWTQIDDFADEMVRVEDAAIVRQALSMLSPAERAALVMWELENRSTEEIGAELGIHKRTVRYTISRARSSLRRVLSELVVDEVRGLTALDLLSNTYIKTSNVVRKSSKGVLSLLLMFFAFAGFNTFSSNFGISSLSSENASLGTREAQSISSEELLRSNLESSVGSQRAKVKEDKSIKSGAGTKFQFPGLDEAGVPKSFTAADSSGGLGPAYFQEREVLSKNLELVRGQVIKTEYGAANILISQVLGLDKGVLTYDPIVSFGQAGAWIPLEVEVTSTDLSLQEDGNYLLTAYIAVESAIETLIRVKATTDGRDLAYAPRQVITRLLLDANKTQVLAQAVYVVERGASA